MANRRRVELVQLSPATLRALVDGDLAAANVHAPFDLGSAFVSPEWTGTWRRRSLQIEADPSSAVWVTRAVVDVDSNVAVGRAGFHGPPDPDGMVEVGYAIDPAFRRLGYARAALIYLLEWARNDRSVRTVRASIRPDNFASRALVDQFGFVAVGEQWDDEDGLEIVLERAARLSTD